MRFSKSYINSLTLIFLFLAGTCIRAQSNKSVMGIDSLRRVLKDMPDDSNKVNVLNKLSNKQEQLGNEDSSLYYANLGEEIAEKIGFNKNEASIYNFIGNSYFQKGNFPGALECYFKGLTIARENGNSKTMAAILGNLGNIYVKQGNYPQAVEYYFKALNLSEQIGNKEGMASHLSNLAIAYEEQGNYAQALEYNFKSLKMAQEVGSKYIISHTLDNIGVIYDKQGKYDSALAYQFNALKVGLEISKHENATDIGNTYGDKGDYAKALEYYYQALNQARGAEDKDAMANLYSNIGGIYTKLKNYKEAKGFLDSALTLSKKVGDKIFIKNTYRALCVLDSATGSYKTSYEDYEKYIAYRDSLINQESVKRITQMDMGYKYEKREDSIIAEHEKADIIKSAEIKSKNIITDSAIVISILTLLLAILLINQQQIKRKRDKIIFENEKQYIENELKSSKTMLGEYVKSMLEKNNLIEQFKNDLEGVKSLKAKEEIEDKRIEQLEYLNKITILTEEDWNKFKELFEQVYKGFFIRLKEKLPNLTQAETRLICLTKLKLDTKHMAAIIGVSATTIEQSRYRLRKKLNLSKDDSLTGIIESI
jgi:tetratricopeptide (TPR) repeat protein